MGAQMMAIVAEGSRGRIYLSPTAEQVAIAVEAQPEWAPETDLPEQALSFRVQFYGMARHRDLFTPRQLVALSTFSDLVSEARERATQGAVAAGLPDDSMPLAKGGMGAMAYGDAVATYLGLAVSRTTDYQSTLCTWASNPQMEIVRGTFARQALPMTWDFAEGNLFGPSTGSFDILLQWVTKVIDLLPGSRDSRAASVDQMDARADKQLDISSITSTDPPYYDNIGYADLADFFYVWLRRCLGKVYPDLFGTMLVPKAQELIATPYRFEGSKERARAFFEDGLGQAFTSIRAKATSDYPMTVYYAFRQAESEGDDGANGTGAVASTGWETMLTGLINAGFTITGTWPMRSERGGRMNDIGANALASSIVLVCRPRPVDAPRSSRRDFVMALRRELPRALRELQHGNIAPVDLAQATIGPGMAIFSQFSQVMEADGSPMRVRTALQMINQALDEVLTEQEGEFDADTRWALAWFEQFGAGEGPYGVAETLSKAKNTSVAGLAEAGVLVARGGKVRLFGRDEMPQTWNPAKDTRLTVWETTQHLIRVLEQAGESGAAHLLAELGDRGEVARDLAYRLYTICERKGWAEEAWAYNSLVITWPQITQLAHQHAATTPRQQQLFT